MSKSSPYITTLSPEQAVNFFSDQWEIYIRKHLAPAGKLVRNMQIWVTFSPSGEVDSLKYSLGASYSPPYTEGEIFAEALEEHKRRLDWVASSKGQFRPTIEGPKAEPTAEPKAATPESIPF